MKNRRHSMKLGCSKLKIEHRYNLSQNSLLLKILEAKVSFVNSLDFYDLNPAPAFSLAKAHSQSLAGFRILSFCYSVQRYTISVGVSPSCDLSSSDCWWKAGYWANRPLVCPPMPTPIFLFQPTVEILASMPGYQKNHYCKTNDFFSLPYYYPEVMLGQQCVGNFC